MIRLFVSNDLHPGAGVALSLAQVRYLVAVMRVSVGDEVRVFNGRDGEWAARVAEVSRRDLVLRPGARVRDQAPSPDLELFVALVKRPRLETIVEKAAELGARSVTPLVTDRVNARGASLERLSAIAIEAAEQTGRLDVPAVRAPARLAAVLGAWPVGRRLMFCDEAGDAGPALDALAAAGGGPWAILIGPEGGFSPAERAAVRALAAVVPVSLGPRILRADTAAIAALTLWQAALGDWRGA